MSVGHARIVVCGLYIQCVHYKEEVLAIFKFKV